MIDNQEPPREGRRQARLRIYLSFQFLAKLQGFTSSKMVVRIRLSRFGCKNKPFYRVMAADSRSPRDGKHLEVLGYYNPLPG